MNLTPLQTTLLEAHGKTVTHRGNRYKLDCRMIGDRFTCDALNLTPKTEEESKFCYTDLWKSESDSSNELLRKFAALAEKEAA